MPASEIIDNDSLKKWLRTQPIEVAQAIAARAALRVFPFVLGEVHPEKLTEHDFANLTISVFRATFISWAARKYPAHDMKPAAADAAAAAAAFDAAYAAADTAAAAAYAAYADAADAAAAYAAYAADAAADTAAAYAADADAAVRADGEWLERTSGNTVGLIGQPLWLLPSNVPDGYKDLQDRLAQKLADFRQSDFIAQHPSFGLVSDWYAAILPISGTPRSLFGEEKDILLATQDDDFWGGDSFYGDPFEVLDRVAELVGWPDEYRGRKSRFFISYSTKDEPAAKFIGDVIQEAGHNVFAQYNDMPPGSVFIEEMKRGLAAADRFVPVLSPNYETSDYCQAEWNAAFSLDPLGVKRKFLPFLVSPATLNGFAGTFVYTNLINQNDDERRALILDALNFGGGLTRKEQRKKLAASSSPQITITERQELGTTPNEVFDQPIADPDIIAILHDIQQLLTGLCLKYGKNNQLAVFHQALESYRNEIVNNGVEPSVGSLDNAIKIIKAEIDEDEQGFWYKGGTKQSLIQLLDNHQKLLGYFPRDAIRKRLESIADINLEYVTTDAIKADLNEFVDAINESRSQGLVTSELTQLIEQKIYYRKQLQILKEKGSPILPDDIFVSDEDRILKGENEDKKWGANFGATLDNILTKAEKVVSLTDSETGKALISATVKIVSKLWGG